MSLRSFFLHLTALLFFASSALAHDPDAEIVEVPEVSIVGARPMAASSQQFIPDREYLLPPQGRPAQVLRLIPGMITMEHSG